MSKKLFCLISLVSLLVVATAVRADVIFSDNFDHAMTDDWDRINYQGWYEQNVLASRGYPASYPGGPWTIGAWDGYQSMPSDVNSASPTVLAYNFVDTFNAGMDEANSVQAWMPGREGPVANGVLTITSSNGAWQDARNTGAFLFKMVKGDFVARVQVVGADYWWYAMGGLMARAPGDGVVEVNAVGGIKLSEVGSTGAKENWVYLNYFPLYNVGNNVRNTLNGVSTEIQTPWKGYPCDPYLELSRVGNTFFFKTSPDGVTYTSLPGLEAGVVRDDLPAEVQVGIFQGNFNGDWQTTMQFDNFVITVKKKIIYVTDSPDVDVNGTMDDQGWIDWLVAEGYDVDARRSYWKEPLDVNRIAQLEAADLVIASRGLATTNYDAAGEAAKWNGLRVPVLCVNVYMIRNNSNRWYWVNSIGTIKTNGSPPMLVTETAHPIFKDVPVDEDGLVEVLDATVGEGVTAFFDNTLVDGGNGTELSICLGAVSQSPWIIEWPAGVEFYAGAGQFTGDIRMLFSAGTQDRVATGVLSPQGAFNLNDAGQQLLRNIIKYMLSK
jgi:hypothetical protein